LLTRILRQKSLYRGCHSGLDPESSISELDSRFRGNDDFGTNVKKRWTHFTSLTYSSLVLGILYSHQCFLITLPKEKDRPSMIANALFFLCLND
jgi:hypothetical protein